MLRNYLAAAVRNLSRNRLHAVITTASLAIGFAAAIIAASLWRYETGYDRFWPNAERTYLVAEWRWSGDQSDGALAADVARRTAGPDIAEQAPQVEAMSRWSYGSATLWRGDVVAQEANVQWADPNLFDLLRMQPIAGDLRTALARPDAIVLTRTLARKYFGDADPMGQTILAGSRTPEGDERKPLVVTAVIEDLPPNSHMEAAAFRSMLGREQPIDEAYTYLRLRPGAGPGDLSPVLANVARSLTPATTRYQLKLLRLDQVYLPPAGYRDGAPGRYSGGGSQSGERLTLYLAAALAGLILLTAAINFVTLMTARGAQRAREVGVRKASGANRGDLVLQFLGEALLYSGLALGLGMALAEVARPVIGAAIRLDFPVDYLADPMLLAAIVGGAAVIGLAAGFYPALALSAYRPALVLKGGMAKTPGSALLRHILVSAQVLPLIFLALIALTLTQHVDRMLDTSRQFAIKDGLIIEGRCTEPLLAKIRAAPGVGHADCMARPGWRGINMLSAMLVGSPTQGTAVRLTGGQAPLDLFAVSESTLKFFELEPVAGRLLTKAEAADRPFVGLPSYEQTRKLSFELSEASPSVVINQSAARRLGFSDPKAAVGQTLEWRPSQLKGFRRSTIVGVVADRGGVADYENAIYYLGREADQRTAIGVKVVGEDRPATLAAIDRAWAELGSGEAIDREFYDDALVGRFGDELAFVRLFGVIIGIGVLIAASGLFALSAFLAQQRVKEIGVRKAMGAARGHVLRILLLQFARPVIIANLLAVPVAVIGMAFLQREMEASSRMAMGLPVILPVVLGSLAIALGATFVHAWQVTRARPVDALRYE